ncbi:hypothetical protein LEP1GSC024_0094 [Leptospira noguchii str. 2001034031]|uniref:Uncharacterized protein n=1 Tax=Leptospira noguchii str. 2001034031 TaxID=1193053 RepID=M6YGP3_9LEPT|nr:hypothetical protein LEP1GSC024_0094 [Leptospira noguchii str. 2001034031]
MNLKISVRFNILDIGVFVNWAVNLLSGLVAFSFFPKKPSLNLRSKDNCQFLLAP